MQNLKITISELGQEDIVRDMTEEEIAILEAYTKTKKDLRLADEKAKTDKEATKAEVLAKLGLTDEEAQALLG